MGLSKEIKLPETCYTIFSKHCNCGDRTGEDGKNGKPSEINVICMILSWLNSNVCCDWRLHQKTLHLYHNNYFHSGSLLLPLQAGCLLQRSSSKTPFQNQQQVMPSSYHLLFLLDGSCILWITLACICVEYIYNHL